MAVGGFVGKILRVNLADKSIKTLNTFDYVPEYIGGAALGYRLLWDEINENTTEWSPENCVIFVTGPCAGTPVPSSGRTAVVGLAPQSYPIPYACTSNFGGDFGPKMKFAGYDGIIIVGKSPDPVYIYVSGDEVEVRDGEQLWGLGLYDASDILAQWYGDDVATAAIGPAGENKCRWAAIESNTENGAGQGGFGAVMGDKNLKAVVVKPGTAKIPVANPDKLIEVTNRIAKEMSPAGQNKVALIRDRGTYTSRRQSCAWSGCTGGISGCLPTIHTKVPNGLSGYGTTSKVEYCASGLPSNLMNLGWGDTRGSTLKYMSGQLGLNNWEQQLGMNFWMLNEYQRGRLKKILGEDIPGDGENMVLSPEFVAKWFNAISYREGEGDAWAEATPRAAKMLGLEDEVWKTHKHGYGPHWDGRYLQFVRNPVWIFSALASATHGRDCFNHMHGYVERYPTFVEEWADREGQASTWGTPRMPYSKICELAPQIYYGAENANSGWDNPDLQYVDKEYVTLYHECVGIIKDSVPVCDRQFPLLYDTTGDEPKVGWISAETDAYNAVVGTDWTLLEMHDACKKVQTLLRSIWIMQGRTRDHDESVIPYFTQPDAWPDDPSPSVIDADQFRAALGRYYDLHGWDQQARPTRQTLEGYGLKFVADKLASLGKLPG
ncbi:MAG: aldehyde ferredoxin oxidoreductase N-terminal domain-containing protein [Dehalococcoidales bacterium]|nr:aldehyde ferredoxin oxidoreductase N-terminal domain-containing protein [Dehalococcoidales bacterium]